MRWISLAFLIATVAQASDRDAYCKGFCLARYQDGYSEGVMCACIDYLKPPEEGRLEVPKRAKGKPETVPTYNSYNLDLLPYLKD